MKCIIHLKIIYLSVMPFGRTVQTPCALTILPTMPRGLREASNASQQGYPKHPLGQKFSLQGKIGRIFPQRENFLKIAFLFPWNGLFPQDMKGLGEKELLQLEGKYLTFPREGKFTSSNSLASKDVWGRLPTTSRKFFTHDYPCPKVSLT